MPTIKSSADLRNNYNEISTFCHTYTEPVFITKNGKGDLAVMSIEAYEEMTSRFELYGLIKKDLMISLRAIPVRSLNQCHLSGRNASDELQYSHHSSR